MRQTHPHYRRGFTLVELLVVIGVILLLLTIAVLGYRHLDAAAAHRETVAELKACQAMLIEYENSASLRGIEGTWTGAPIPAPPAPIYADNPAATPPKASIALADVAGDMTDASGTGTARFSAKAVTKTKQIMAILLRIPKNRTLVGQLPPKRLMQPPPNASAAQQYTMDAGVIVLDGWNNPIIFVPAGGLQVNILDPVSKAEVTYVIRSTGRFPLTDIKSHPMTGQERPFFASAGQDGWFAYNNTGGATTPPDYGSDNIYSFEE